MLDRAESRVFQKLLETAARHTAEYEDGRDPLTAKSLAITYEKWLPILCEDYLSGMVAEITEREYGEWPQFDEMFAAILVYSLRKLPDLVRRDAKDTGLALDYLHLCEVSPKVASRRLISKVEGVLRLRELYDERWSVGNFMRGPSWQPSGHERFGGLAGPARKAPSPKLPTWGLYGAINPPPRRRSNR